MNLFEAIRGIAEIAASGYADAHRLEVDLRSARVLNLGAFRFQVEYVAVTPGGVSKSLFVQVHQEGDNMVARAPFSNAAPSFSLAPFRARWSAPHARTQQDYLNEAVYKNHVNKKNV